MIGKRSIERVNMYCCEDISLIENYEEAVKSEKRYCCHHRNGIDKSGEQLKEEGLYYNRPASELIFLEFREHTRLHMQNLREETRQKLSGENNGMYGKHHKEETKQKMSNTHKGEKNGMAKECVINGTTYGSLTEAHKALYPNMPYKTFHRKYKEGKL